MKIKIFLILFFITNNLFSQTYCTVSTNYYSSGCYANITEFDFGDIQNSVFNSLEGYYDYLDMQTEIKPGQTIMMTISFDRYNITSNNIIGGVVYIDWNRDFDFEDENERVFQNLNINGKGTFAFPVHVPDNAVEGITRLRARTDDDTYNTIEPCGYAEETQDYTLIITSKVSLSKPTELSATGTTSNTIKLVWNDNSSSEISYHIERSLDSVNFTQSFTVESNTIEYTDADLNAGTTYYYRIAAISDADTSAFSEIVTAKTLAIDFEKITEGNLVTYTNFTVGAFWGDYNNDNKLDIYTSGDNILFTNENGLLNNSELLFKRSGSAAWADYNNDGELDLLITSYNYASGTPNNILYKNNGNNSFSEVIPFEADGRVTNCVWLDFDNDGKLDIFVSYIDLFYGKLYINNGDDTFTEHIKIDNASGFSTFADYDNDNDLDLFVCQYYNNLLFNNNGDGTFTKNQSSGLTISSEPSNGASWGDIDNDGDLDLFVTNGKHNEENNSLYLNNGNGSFSEVFSGAIVNNGGESYGSSFCDIDNDGNLDLVVANFYQKNYLYMGNGDGTFNEIEQSIIANEFSEIFLDEIASIACATGDYNQDGFSDLLITNTGGIENFLYKNSGNLNHWIKLKLIGNQSNTSAIGAKVIVKVGNKTQYKEITSQTGFAAQNELIANFGVGEAILVDSIIVKWPSGEEQILTNINVDQLIEINETAFTLIDDIILDIDIKIFPNPASNYILIENKKLKPFLFIELLDLNGRVFISQQFNDDEKILDISALPIGMYLLRISDEKSIAVKKIIKQ